MKTQLKIYLFSILITINSINVSANNEFYDIGVIENFTSKLTDYKQYVGLGFACLFLPTLINRSDSYYNTITTANALLAALGGSIGYLAGVTVANSPELIRKATILIGENINYIVKMNSLSIEISDVLLMIEKDLKMLLNLTLSASALGLAIATILLSELDQLIYILTSRHAYLFL
ncbi:hypothetical protein [Endozoicomonas sp. 2B-B]